MTLSYPLYNSICYYESDCNGYYCFTRIGDSYSTENYSDCVSCISVDPCPAAYLRGAEEKASGGVKEVEEG